MLLVELLLLVLAVLTGIDTAARVAAALLVGVTGRASEGTTTG